MQIRQLAILLVINCWLAVTTIPAQQSENRVIVMGMIHGKHRSDDLYSLNIVKQIIRRVNPDIVLTEIPPDRLAAATAQFQSTGKITEARVSRFPEYVDALFPLTKELDFKIVPCAAWTKQMNDDRQEVLAELKLSHADQYAEMEAAQAKASAEIAKMGPVNDPAVIHTDQYDDLVRQGMEPYDRHFNERIGQGGWTNINKAHYALIDQALNQYSQQGKKILITFGSWHKYYIKDQLRKRNDIKLISLRHFFEKKMEATRMTDWPRFRLAASNAGSHGRTEIRQPAVIWKYDTGEIIESSPAVVEERVYIGGHSKKMVALNRQTGAKIWDFETAGWIRASPSVVDSTVYFGSDDNRFYALDASTGTKRWEIALGQGGEQSSPAIDNGVVYFGGFDNFVYALDAESGRLKWKLDTGASMLSSPALSPTAAIIATYAGQVWAIGRDTGRKIWTFQANDKPIFSSPVYLGGKVFVTSYDHHIYCLNSENGKLIWKYKTDDEVFSSPAVVDGTLYVGSNDNHLYALTADQGTVIWKSNLNGAVFASPAVTNESIYVGSSDGNLYCVHRQDGTVRWKFFIGAGIKVWSSAAAVNGRVYFGSHAGELVVLGEAENGG